MTKFNQQRFNQQVTDVLDQMAQEMTRQREGKTLSNLEGIRQTIWNLVKEVERDEELNPNPQHINIG